MAKTITVDIEPEDMELGGDLGNLPMDGDDNADYQPTADALDTDSEAPGDESTLVDMDDTDSKSSLNDNCV